MITYHVYLRRGLVAIVSAERYTEDKRTKRFYFYSDLKAKNKETFFSVPDVAGINKISDGSSPPVDIYRQYDEVLKKFLDADASVPAAATQKVGKRRRKSG